MNPSAPPIDNLEAVLRVLPPAIREIVEECQGFIEELVLDAGEQVWVKFARQAKAFAPQVRQEQLEDIAIRLGGFRPQDLRASLEGSLHRVSGEYEYGELTKITLRFARLGGGIGKQLAGHVLVGGLHSLLIIGPPGSRKTTRLRQLCWDLGEVFGKYVVVVDSANELGGDSIQPHSALGQVRRFRVENPRAQAETIYRAVANHYPLIVVVDELRERQEVEAVVQAVSRGVKPIATVHGYSLEQVMDNPANWAALGLCQVDGVRRRTTPLVFERVVVIESPESYRVYQDANAAIDAVLRGEAPEGLLVVDGLISQQEVNHANSALFLEPSAFLGT